MSGEFGDDVRVRRLAVDWCRGVASDDAVREAAASRGIEAPGVPVDDLLCELAAQVCRRAMRALLDARRRRSNES